MMVGVSTRTNSVHSTGGGGTYFHWRGGRFGKNQRIFTEQSNSLRHRFLMYAWYTCTLIVHDTYKNILATYSLYYGFELRGVRPS